MSEKIIVVDDDEAVNESLSELLEVMDLNVVAQGYDGKEAVELYSKHLPDFTLIDLNMPNFDGFYALEQIRKQNQNALVFIVTGDVTTKAKEKLEKLGVTGIFYKPFKIGDLVNTLRSAKSSGMVGYAA